MERDEFPTCPRCATALDRRGERLVCTACHGLQLNEAEISQLVAEMLVETVSMFGWRDRVAEPQPLALEDRAGERLTCPQCVAAMEPRRLYGLDVDRCPAHGIWFDGEELEQALQAAATLGKRRSTVGEKVFAAVAGPALIAAYVLELVFGRGAR